jgi:hypothetical protein
MSYHSLAKKELMERLKNQVRHSEIFDVEAFAT